MQRIWQMMLALGCIGYHNIVAANSEIKFQRLELDRSPTQSGIRDFVQDTEGYLWLGTQFSVDRFDGYRFQNLASGPGKPDSISGSFVQDLLLDQSGMIWVGTQRGLNRIDPQSRQVKQYSPEKLGIQSGMLQIASLSESRDGMIYATTSKGPLRWNNLNDQLEWVNVTNPLQTGHIIKTAVDHAGNIWLAGNNGIWLFDSAKDRFEPFKLWPDLQTDNTLSTNILSLITTEDRIVYINDAGVFFISPTATRPIEHLRPENIGFFTNVVVAVAAESSGKIWLLLPNGLLRIDPQDWQDRHFFPLTEIRLPEGLDLRSNLQIAETRNHRVWLAGRFGLALFDQRTNTLQTFRHDPNDPYSLPPSLGVDGYRIFVDQFNVLWVTGSLGGLAYVPPHSDRFLHLRDTTPSSYSLNIVRAITEHHHEGREYVWVSNQNAGVSVWQHSDSGQYSIVDRIARTELHPVGDVRRMVRDPNLNSLMWLAGLGGLGYIDTSTRALTLVHSDRSFRAAVFSDPSTLWVSRSNQVLVLDTRDIDRPEIIHTFNVVPQSGRGRHFETFGILPLSSRRAIAVGLGGVVSLDLDTQTVSRFYPGGDPREAFANNVFSIAQTDDGSIWIGTRGGGLAQVHGVSEDQLYFSFITTEDGLSDNTIYAIAPDSQGHLWLSSNQGLMRYSPANGEVRAYGPEHGVQHHEFNNTVAHIGQSGRYYFGGINGWNVFSPSDIKQLTKPPIVHLESVQINDRPIQTIQQHADPLTLSHTQNRMVFDYLGLHFASPKTITYAYKLNGVDADWVYAGLNRQARYASIPPGEYSFEVKAANVDGIWSEPKTLFTANISNPPWLTWWAYLLYGVFAIGLMVSVASYYRHRQRVLQKLVNERTAELVQQKNLVAAQASELEGALEARNIFFANISHEFRTPLTLIQASLNKLTRGPDRQAANTGQRYIDRLLRLVEQLLDLSRLRSRDCCPKESDSWRLDAVVEQIAASFQPLAKQKRLELSYRSDGQWLIDCEQELVEKIVLNLLDNALKFTPEGRKIKVLLAAENNGIQLQVIDNGIGIPESEQKHLFERFFRASSAETNRTTGAGVGLALVYEAVRSAGGQIRLESGVGEGSCFTVWLPAEQIPDKPGASNSPAETSTDTSAKLQHFQRTASDEIASDPILVDNASQTFGQTVLIVEDNTDLRAYLAEVLADQWTVIEAEDGVEGAEKARENLPDLIISDLMMPRADGFEMLNHLRSDIETSHIPILFLTARQDEQTRLKAITLSADAFLEKPFNPEELKARLDQIAESRARLSSYLRKQLQEGHQENPSTETEEHSSTDAHGALSPKDQKFLKKLNKWLDAHFDDPETSPQRMSQALHITPRTLQRKIKALCAQTPAAYLRDYRLSRARHLLKESDQTITQIAHACGFSSSQYFSRVFSKAVGLSPDQWRQKQS